MWSDYPGLDQPLDMTEPTKSSSKDLCSHSTTE